MLVTAEELPIMRLHWHGEAASKAASQPGSQSDESENKRLTLKEESVIYATSS